MTNYAHQVDIDICMQEVVEPEIPTDPIVERLNLVERENEDLKEKLKRIEGEKMELELHVADALVEKGPIVPVRKGLQSRFLNRD